MIRQRTDWLSQVMKEQAASLLMERHRREIERAIYNVKRTALDKWFRKQYYRAKAKSRWSSERWRRYHEWRREQAAERDKNCHSHNRQTWRYCREKVDRQKREDGWEWLAVWAGRSFAEADLYLRPGSPFGAPLSITQRNAVSGWASPVQRRRSSAHATHATPSPAPARGRSSEPR